MVIVEGDNVSDSCPPQRSGLAVASGILGWTLDAFDFFVVVFLVDTLSTHFRVGKASIVLSIGATLVTRPLGALLFGMLGDRYGRRKPLMAVVGYFSLIELLSGFAVNFPMFFWLRLLYGIGMGGFWGVGASLTLESAPIRWRGLFSGLLQGGYPLGYLLAAVAARFILPTMGWRSMFWAGLVPAAITIFVAYLSPESAAWKQHHTSSIRDILRIAWEHRKSFAYLLAMLTLMTCLSHGTQDLYPDFLKTARHIFPNTVALLAIFYNIGALVGTLSMGHISQWLGRRKAIVCSLTLCLAVIPLWTFGRSLTSLALGAFLMQVGVQGAWGIVPIHLNELSPDAIRSLFPGFVYQLGVLLASPASTLEYLIQAHVGYEWALTSFEVCIIVFLGIIVAFGPERKGKLFLRESV